MNPTGHDRLSPAGLRRRLANSVVFPLLLMIVFAAVLVGLINYLMSVSRLVEHSDRVLAHAYNLQKQIIDAETGLRGFLLKKDQIYLEPYQETSVPQAFAKLRNLVSDNPAQLRQIDEAARQFDQWQSYAERSKRQPDELSEMHHGKRIMDRIRDRFEALITAEEFLRSQRIARSAAAVRAVLGIALALTLAAGLGLGFLSRRQIVITEQAYKSTLHDLEQQTDALRESERRSGQVVNSNIFGIAFTDLNGRIKQANQAFLDILGYRDEDVRAGNLRWDKLTPPEQLHRDLEAQSQIVARGRCAPYEKEFIRRDGARVPVLVGASVLGELKDNKTTDVVCFVLDISDRKEAEQERDHLLVSERAAREEAERTSRVKDEFLANLSHELRTPLNAILGWAQLLSTTRTPDDLDQGMAAILRSAQAQAKLIEDLLDMSRIISGKIRLDVSHVDLAAVIESALAAVRPAAEAKSIRLQTTLGEVGEVAGDGARLQQVVWNLLTNAIKFTPKNGRVQVVLERVNSHVEITVSDSGIGIPPDFLPHVFDRFAQAETGTKKRFSGMGLGLAIVKHLVELHGGSVQAKSRGENQGAAFVIALPLAPITPHTNAKLLTPAPSTAQPVTQRFDLQGVSVLVVDDEADTRAVLSRLLSESGAKVLSAASVAEAELAIQQNSVNILISDLGMPEQDGYDLIRKLRSQGNQMPAVALTAFARAEDRLRSLQAGYQMHIAKPVEQAELLTVIASLTQRL